MRTFLELAILIESIHEEFQKFALSQAKVSPVLFPEKKLETQLNDIIKSLKNCSKISDMEEVLEKEIDAPKNEAIEPVLV